MANKYKVITLCGSIKFKGEFLTVCQQLTLNGYVVLMPTIFDDNMQIENDKLAMLKNIHFQRIDMADEIFVINKNGHIGESTKNEIEYAAKSGKKINYLEPIK